VKWFEIPTVRIDPLPGMDSTPLRADVPDWLTLAPQEAWDRAYILHRVYKTGLIEAQHVGSDSDLDRPYVPDWPTAEQFAEAARKEAEWASHVRASSARPTGRSEPGPRRKLPTPVTKSSSSGFGGRSASKNSSPFDTKGDRRPEGDWHLTDGEDDVLVCWRCREVWTRAVAKGPKPHRCPSCT
jgi:hypothetical protein